MKKNLPRNIQAIIKRIRKRNFPFEKLQKSKTYYNHEVFVEEIKESNELIGWTITYDNKYTIEIQFKPKKIIVNNWIKKTNYIQYDYIDYEKLYLKK